MGNLLTRCVFGSQSITTDHNEIPSNKTYQNPHQSVSEHDKLRIVMLGKTGVGKSTTGNTTQGKQSFGSEFSPKSLTSYCEKHHGEADGQKVAVIDTPGLFDTRIQEEKNLKDIAQCISFASPGPHVFLVIIKLDRFTAEEEAVQKIREIFGEDADKYSMVLFTHGDLLKGKPIEDFLAKSKDLRELVAKCSGQYHVFNNELEDRSQVRELLNKIRNIKEMNGGSYYTTEMFEKAEKEIEERKQRILKEKEEKNHKEQEELEKQIKEKYEKEMREANAEREKELKEKYEKEMREANAEREKQLKEAYERELEEKIGKLKKNQEEEAQREAEKSTLLLKVIAEFILKWVRQFLFK